MMYLFFSGNKKDMMILRDTINDLLSDPVLDQKGTEIQLKHEKGEIAVNRKSVVEIEET